MSETRGPAARLPHLIVAQLGLRQTFRQSLLGVRTRRYVHTSLLLCLYCSHSCILHIGSEQDGRRRSGLLRERGHGSLLRAALLVGAAADRGVRTASLDPLLARVRRHADAHVSG